MEPKELLDKLRKKIDLIDSELLRLINQRMEYTLRTRKLKAGITDPAREREVIDSIRRRSGGLLNPSFTEKIFKELINESKRLQEKDLKLIGFQGEHGAYGEVAVKMLDPSLVPVPCVEFAGVFSEVINGQLDFGIVPVENSLEGAVTQVNDLLVEMDVNKIKIVGEVKIPVHHCLLALPGTDRREIKVVYSHPQALAQCRKYLTRYKLEPRPYYDTAGAAMMLAEEKPKAAAAIASSLCADIYHLEILAAGIADEETNSTRFLVLSREETREAGNKCSVVFSTEHKAGSLFAVLRIFTEAGLNLTRIESRPIKKDPGKYAFLLDFQGSDRDPGVRRALAQARKETVRFKFLGCYREANGQHGKKAGLSWVNE